MRIWPYLRRADPKGFFRTGAAAAGYILALAGIAMLAAGFGRAASDLTPRQLCDNLKSKTYSGEQVELRFQNSSLPEILSKFEEISGLTFKIIPPLDQRKYYTFLGYPWDRALASILLDYGLELRLEGDILLVDYIRPEKDWTIPAFLVGILTAVIFFGGIALVYTRRRRQRRNRDRERKITLDAAAIEENVQRLQYLFQVERIQRNSRLSLNSLAERLSLQPYQLSGIINGRMGKTFSDFVADFRIEEVKKRLSDPGETANILDIAYDAGFGTKAAFNRIFKDRTGLTPREFKRKNSAVK